MSGSDVSTASQSEQPANAYRLRCTACSFETVVEGNSLDALNAADGHKEAHEGDRRDHFVNFAIDRSKR